jgi:hypothetical protein
MPLDRKRHHVSNHTDFGFLAAHKNEPDDVGRRMASNTPFFGALVKKHT